MSKVRVKHKFDFCELLFVLALALKPLYLTGSGNMQISDYIYMLLFGILLINGKLYFPSRQERNWTFGFIILILYQFAVNLIWYVVCTAQGYGFALMQSMVFYIFNFFVCLTVFQMCVRVGFERLLHLMLIGTSISVVICLAGIAVNWEGIGRVTGFFNNPNQLGYFSILTSTVFVVFCKDTSKRLTIVMLILGTLMNVWSLSKASLIGGAVLLVAYAIISHNGRYTRGLIFTVIMILLIAVAVYIVLYSESESLQENYYIMKVRRQLFNMSNERDTDLGTGRGYNRIKEIGFFVLTGVGQGAYDRFEAIRGKELHSTFATLIVSYGMIGFTGYSVLFGKAVFANKKWFFNLLAMSGALLYSITHNGIRNSLLWTLLSMLLLRQNAEKSFENGALLNQRYFAG